MKAQNQIQMKTYEQLLPKFSSEPGLEYKDSFVYPNNSIFRGQMKKVDENVRMKMRSSDKDSRDSNKGGSLQNRLSAKDQNMDAGESQENFDDNNAANIKNDMKSYSDEYP